MKFRLLPAIVLAGLAAACSEPPGQYRISAQDAYQKLIAADFLEFRRDRQCGILIHIKSEGDEGKSVTWRVTSSGREMLNFTAHLLPVDATRTKIDIEVSKEVKNGREAYDGTHTYARPAVMQPVRPAIVEQIDAILTDRPFAWQNVRKATESASPSGTFKVMTHDDMCYVQRGNLTEGRPLSIDDVEENLMSE